MKKLIQKTILLVALQFAGNNAIAQTASLQVIHNCADAAAQTVDIYAGTTLLINDLQFRFASSTFTNIPAGVPIVVGVAPGTSTSSADAIATFTINLSANSSNIVVADGIVSAMGYNPSSTSAAFTLNTFTAALSASPSSTTTSLLVHHGSTDAPVVDVVAPFTGSNAFVPNALVNNIAYGNFSAGYLNLPTADYRIQIRDQTSENVVAEYLAPLSTLNLGGAALSVIASGFLNPANNSNGPAFGLYVASAAGGSLLPLPTSTISSTRLQAIHNCADLAAAQVDVWVRTANTVPTAVKLIDNFAFRTASPFVEVPAAENVTLYIASPTSTSEVGAIAQFTYNLSSSSKYQLIASGIVSPTGYSPAPAFNLAVFANAAERSTNPMNTDLLVYHGATDAPAVNVVADGAGTLFSNLIYGAFSGNNYSPLASSTSAGDYTLRITNTAGTTTVASYGAPLNTLGTSGLALTVLASGFLDPSVNSNGASFGLYAALPSGGPLVPLPPLNTITTGVSNINFASQVKVYPNPVTDQLIISNTGEGTLTYEIRDFSSRLLKTGTMTETAATVEMTDMADGIYFLKLTQNGEQATIKLVK